MTQKEKIEIIVKKLIITDDQFVKLKQLVNRLEDRINFLEDRMESMIEERREVIFESDFNLDGDDSDDDE